MQEHRLLPVFARLIADFFHKNQSYDHLKLILQHCAQALLQGQEHASIRQYLKFEGIQHFTTQYLTTEERAYLNELLIDTERNLPSLSTKIQLFFREMPTRAIWLGSIPEWAFGAKLHKTIAPIQNRDGRRFWIDVYEAPTNPLMRTVWMDNTNRPILHLNPLQPIESRIITQVQGRIASVNMGEGEIWLKATLLNAEAPDEAYCGLKITRLNLVFPTNGLSQLRVIRHPASPNIKATLTIELAPNKERIAHDTSYGEDVRISKIKLPDSIKLTFSPSDTELDEVNGQSFYQVYGNEKNFEWKGEKPNYDRGFRAIAIPLSFDDEQWNSPQVQSPILGISGQSKLKEVVWLLPATKLTTPLVVEDNGKLKTLLEEGLAANFTSWLDANQVDMATVKLNQIILINAAHTLEFIASRAVTENALQKLHLWNNNSETSKESNTLEIRNHNIFPIIYQCEAQGKETIISVGACEGTIDRPVNANGKAFALKTQKSLFVRTYSAEGDDFLVSDDNLLESSTVSVRSSTFKSEAIALNNALLTVSPIHTFLLSGHLPSFSSTFQSASLIYSFGLLGYLPTLPDPYVANTGVFQWMLDELQGENGYYGLEQIRRLLVASMKWENTIPPNVRFIFGDITSPENRQRVSLHLLTNEQLATRNAESQFSTRAGKTSERIKRRTDRGIETWEHEYNFHVQVNDGYQNRNFFSLLDVSTAADWMGVNVGSFDERFFFERTFQVIPEQNTLSADGMDVVATGKFVRLFTVPQISWEPVVNTTKPFNAQNDPPEGLLLFKDDGSPTLIGNTGNDTVPIAPLPLANYVTSNYQNKQDFKVWSFLTLPFGMLAITRYNQNIFNFNSGATIALIQHQFEGKYQTTLQISTEGYLHPIQGNRNFEGITYQLSNLIDGSGRMLNKSILSKTVTDIFNSEFSPSSGKLIPRGVPVERYDFSGYGANIFSNWLNPQAKIGQTSQAKFDVWRGRTAHEVIQVRSIIYPWAIRVVRTITMFRESTGLVYRVDSGWRAESDGVYDFKTEVITGKDAQGNNITQLETNGYNFHAGIIKGVFNVTNIVETQDANLFQRSWNKTTGYFIDDDGIAKPVPAGGKNLTVNLFPVYFDSDVAIDDLAQGGNDGKVPSKRMLGFIQIEPKGIPISSDYFAQLLEENNGLGGAVDCLVNIGNSGQMMRVNRVEVQPSQDENNQRVFVTAAKGTPILPKEGSWSLVQHKKSTGEVLPINSGGVSLIRRGLYPTVSNEPLEIAHPTDLFNPNRENRAIQYAFLQNTDTQKVLFRNPYFKQGEKILNSSKPDLADAYRLLNSKGIFPELKNLPQLDFKDFNLNIVEQGYELLNKFNPEEAFEQIIEPAIAGPLYFVNEKVIKIYVEYAKKDIKGNTKDKGAIKYNLNSAQDAIQKWANKLNDITMVVDLLDMKRLFLIRGSFDTEKGKAPAFIKPELEFGEKLKPVHDILQILLLLQGGNYAEALTKGLKVAMSNSPNNWEYKFQADKEIPALRFPPPSLDSPVAPLRLECYLKLGCYFNVGNPMSSGGGSLIPSGGAYVEFGAKLSVMCVSLAAATVYAVGTCTMRIGADTVSGPNFYLKAGFGIEIMVGLPVIGSVSVYYGAGIEMYIDNNEVIAGAFIVFRGRAELIGGLVSIQILIEAAGKIAARANGANAKTEVVVQVTFSLDISIFLIINISFSETFEERRQIA